MMEKIMLFTTVAAFIMTARKIAIEYVESGYHLSSGINTVKDFINATKRYWRRVKSDKDSREE